MFWPIQNIVSPHNCIPVLTGLHPKDWDNEFSQLLCTMIGTSGKSGLTLYFFLPKPFAHCNFAKASEAPVTCVGYALFFFFFSKLMTQKPESSLPKLRLSSFDRLPMFFTKTVSQGKVCSVCIAEQKTGLRLLIALLSIHNLLATRDLQFVKC